MSIPQTTSTTVAGLLLRAAQLHTNSGVRVVLGSGGRDTSFLSYQALLDQAQHILGGLKKYTCRPGVPVVLLLERPGEFLPAFWGCVLGGYVPCPMVPIRHDQERWIRYLTHIDSLLDRPLFICVGSPRQELPATATVADLCELRNGTASDEVYRAESRNTALLVLTSGSTGNAKAVALTHANLLSSMAGKSERQQLTAKDITLNWISFDHVAALLEAHMLPLHVGATQVHVEPGAILAEPLLFLRLIDRFRVSMTFSPNFLFGQINSALESAGRDGTQKEQFSVDLSCLRHIISGGEANVVETCRRFLDLLEPYGLSRKVLWPAFGMTETCAGSVYSSEFPEVDANKEFASLGHPIDGLEMRIGSDEGGLLETERHGELQLRGPMVFSHYHNNEEATRAAFTADGWFRTGDLGRIEDGRLSLVGRQKDSIIVNGVNYFSQELETSLEKLAGIERAFVAAFPTRKKGADTEELVITFATSFPLTDESKVYQTIAAVRNTTIMLWGFRPSLVLPLPREAFPKTSLGKIQRSLMRRSYESGGFSSNVTHIGTLIKRQRVAYTPPESPMEWAIAEVFAQMFGLANNEVSATGSFFELGGTSLDILRLTQILERRFHLEATLITVLQNPTVRQLAARITASTGQNRSNYNPIVPLQLSGRRTPVFCVHPGNGGVLVFVNLAKYFVNERPFYALRPRGFEPNEGCFETFEEMVNTYYSAIRQCQPQGPYLLAGYSFGGPIAFEIAKRLEKRGERVAFLGCIDFYPLGEDERIDYPAVAIALAWLLEMIDGAQREELFRQVQVKGPTWNPCEHLIQIASCERLAELDMDLAKFSAWHEVAYSVQKSGRSHVTSGMVKAMTVFYGDGAGFTASRGAWLDRLRRWDNFVRNPRYVEVAGSHFTLMAPKHVAEFQAVLRAEIDRAFRQTETL